jgi:hypothetical protein
VGEVSPLNKLYKGYRDKGFEFFTVYVREPHPGENYGPHSSWDQKLQYARDCRDQDGIQNPLLVDDVEGTVHQAYGIMPNMVYIIGKDGKVVYKAMWTDDSEIESVLANLVLADKLRAEGIRVKPSYTEKINYVTAEYAGGIREKVFGRAGKKAWDDYRNVFASKG